MSTKVTTWFWAVSIVALLASCGDPIRDERIEALGDEDPGFAPSAIHRPGQPCVLCHSEYGGAKPEMSMGGTLFFVPASGEPYMVESVIVRLLDAVGNTVQLKSNRCGNFYAEKTDFDPAFPVRAELYQASDDNPDDLSQLIVMSSRISREGSCGYCHRHPQGPLSAGVVYVPGTSTDFPEPEPGSCPPPRYLPATDLPEALQGQP